MDKIIFNAKIYTVDDNKPWAEAVAIKDGKIAAVGKNSEIMAYPLDNPEIIDAGGRLMLPGFIDAHCHPTTFTYKANTADLFSCTTIEEYQKSLKAYYDENPELPVIKGAGWFYADFSGGAPHKKYLDQVISDKPVMLYSGDFHALWVNSKALEMAGIDKNTENPFGGEFERDEDGNPTGYINEIPAVSMVFLLIVMVFAFTLVEANTQLGLTEFIVEVTLPLLSKAWFPAIAFIIAGVLGFATGSFWGIAAILMPIIIPLAFELSVNPFLAAGAVISGIVFASHSCFFGDSLLLAAYVTKIKPMNIAIAVIPYAVICAIITVIGYIVIGFAM